MLHLVDTVSLTCILSLRKGLFILETAFNSKVEIRVVSQFNSILRQVSSLSFDFIVGLLQLNNIFRYFSSWDSHYLRDVSNNGI